MKKRFFVLLLCFFSYSVYAQTTYRLHDKVKANWSGQWYDAEIIEIKNDQYKIHYTGYGNNWDEWMKADRLKAGDTKLATISSDNKYSVGDKVEAWSAGKWYPASIVGIGTDNYKGYYKIHFTEYSDASNQWLNASYVRKTNQKVGAVAGEAPRNGKYRMLSYGSPTNPIYLGYFTLKGGSYTYYNAADKVLGSGTYSYNSTSKTVKWNSGPFKTNGWGGTFEISREGKTHNIRLRSGTIGTNSTDAK